MIGFGLMLLIAFGAFVIGFVAGIYFIMTMLKYEDEKIMKNSQSFAKWDKRNLKRYDKLPHPKG